MTTFSGIAIKKDDQQAVKAYENCFDLINVQAERKFTDYDKFGQELFSNCLVKAKQGITMRGIQRINDWTLITDPEIVDWLEKEKIEQLSQSLQAEIFTFMIQTTSGSFAFAKYEKSLLREFILVAGEVQSDFGQALKDEKGLNINENIFIEDIYEFAHRIGLDLNVRNSNNAFTIKEWIDNNFIPKPLQNQTNTQEEKPWWKIW